MPESFGNPESITARIRRAAQAPLPRVVAASLALSLLPGCGLGKDKKDTSFHDPAPLAFRTSGTGDKETKVIVVPPSSLGGYEDGTQQDHRLKVRVVMECAGVKQDDYVKVSVGGITGYFSAETCDVPVESTEIISPDNVDFEASSIPVEVTSNNQKAHWQLSAETGR